MKTKKSKIPAVSVVHLDKFLDRKQVLFDVNLSIGT